MNIKSSNFLIVFFSENKLLSCFFVSIILSTSFCSAQDMIYLENHEQYKGKLIEITVDKVKFKNLDNPGPIYSKNRNKVKLLFNQIGGFLAIKTLDSIVGKQFEKMVNDFIDPPVHKPETADRIIYINKKPISCTILGEDEKSILVKYYDLDLRIEKDSLAAIIYRDGRHKIVSEINIATDALVNQRNEKILATTMKKNDTKINKQSPIEKEIIEAKNVNEGNQLSIEEKKRQTDSLVSIKALNKNYEQAMSSGLAFLKKGDFVSASEAYTLAQSIKPEETEPLKQLELIDSKLNEMRASSQTELQYASLDSIASSLLVSSDLKDWYTAVATFEKMMDLKPSENYYCLKQIKFLKSQILPKEEEERIEEEIRKKREREKHFNDLIDKADLFVNEKNYDEAVVAYTEALTIHPEHDYAKKRLDIMKHQAAKKNNTEIKQ